MNDLEKQEFSFDYPPFSDEVPPPPGPPPGPPPHHHPHHHHPPLHHHGPPPPPPKDVAPCEFRNKRRRGILFVIKFLVISLFAVSIFGAYNFGRLHERQEMFEREIRFHRRPHHMRQMDRPQQPMLEPPHLMGRPTVRPMGRPMGRPCDEKDLRVQFVDTNGDGHPDFVVKQLIMPARHHSYREGRKGVEALESDETMRGWKGKMREFKGKHHDGRPRIQGPDQDAKHHKEHEEVSIGEELEHALNGLGHEFFESLNKLHVPTFDEVSAQLGLNKPVEEINKKVPVSEAKEVAVSEAKEVPVPEAKEAEKNEESK